MSDPPIEPQPLTNADLREELEDATKQQIIDLLASINALTDLADTVTNAQINANPAVAIKALGREVRTTARIVARLARLVTGAFDDANTGG
jgi:hypothetical protein